MSRRRKTGLDWAIRIVVGLLLAAVGIGVGLLISGGRFTVSSSPPTPSTVAPTRQEVQGQAIIGAQKLVSGVVNVTCVMPTAWSPGDTFTCYAYGSSTRELAQMAGTVLPDDGGRWQMNTVWTALP